MKALTLHQPWASLVALGGKSIETRSWSTAYRGRLLIHAAKRPIRENVVVGDWEAYPPDPPRGPLHPNHDTHRPARLYTNAGSWRLGASWWPLPLGAVVASCDLLDVVPMVDRIPPQSEWRDPWTVMTVEPWPILTTWRGFGSAETVREFSAELPFGDYSPGRFAWLLGDVKPTTERCPRCWPVDVRDRNGAIVRYVQVDPTHRVPLKYVTPDERCPTCGGAGVCEPVPMRGRQGLWTPTWGERGVES